MNRFLITIAALLALATIVSASISCYVGFGGSYTSTTGFDVCYSGTVATIVTKYGMAGVTCSSAAVSGYSCCSTNLCNGAKINGVSILMASAAAMIALFRAM